MADRIELEKSISDLELRLTRTKKELNKSIAIESNAIELYCDGNSACLKIYLNELELSIVLKKRAIESQYGYHQFIPDETEIFNYESNRVTHLGGLLEVNSIQIDNTNDLLSVLNRIEEYPNALGHASNCNCAYCNEGN